jgi:predicted SprT family Zn-dependent metalloprotease
MRWRRRMNLYSARDLARHLMHRHGLHGWTFTFDHARRRFGSCRPKQKRLTLSRVLTLLNGEDEVRDTILHEIAHALTPGDGHGRRWKLKCLEIGARPVRCYTEESVAAPPRRPAPLQIGCPACGWWSDRHRRSNRRLICRSCRRDVVIRPRLATPTTAATAMA